jgi:hypothetical protein
MCFAPQVDVVAGVVITVVAVDAARHCRSARTAPLAALPAIFAFHTFASALVWWGLRGDVPVALGLAALQSYLLIAFVLLPIYVPVAVLLIEPAGWRRWALGVLSVIGTVAGIDFLVGLLAGRGEATACVSYIDYNVTGTSSIAGWLYVIATCGAFLLSGQRPLVLWGALNLLAVGVLALFASRGLPSLWCFWAACTSIFIAWYLRDISPHAAVATEREPVPR